MVRQNFSHFDADLTAALRRPTVMERLAIITHRSD